MLTLAAFHNWCDRCCERCPVQAECPVPQDASTIEQSLGKALAMLEKIGIQEGIPPTDHAPPHRSCVNALHLRKAASEHAAALALLGLGDRGLLLAGARSGASPVSWVVRERSSRRLRSLCLPIV